MPSITLTLTDTPGGGVQISSSYQPTRGEQCSPAQAEALEIISRTRKAWGVIAASTAANPSAVQHTSKAAA